MRRFEFSDDSSNKYWEISISEAELTIRFGRMGAAGTRQTKAHANVAAAEAQFAKLILEKQRKGYREVAISLGESVTRVERPQIFELSQFELGLISEFLTTEAVNFRDHSCNDFVAPANSQNRKVFEAALRHLCGDGAMEEGELELIASNKKADDEVFIWDFCLIEYLAHRANEAALIVAGHEDAGALLSKAERVLTANLLTVFADNDYQVYKTEPGCEDFPLDANSPEKEYLAAVVEHAKRDGYPEKIREIMAGEDIISVFAVDMLRWLALRCLHTVALPALVPVVAPAVHQDSNGVPKLGVAKTWLSEKLILKQATEIDSSSLADYAQNEVDLICYANGGNPFRERVDPDVPARPPFASAVKNLLGRSAQKHGRAAVLALFGGERSLDANLELAKTFTYGYWAGHIEVLLSHRVEAALMNSSLVSCLYKGYWPQARMQAVLLHHAVAPAYNGWEHATSLQRWIACIAFSYWELDKVSDLQKDALPTHVTDINEPALIALYRHWRDADLSPFTDHLVWLCDCYTHQCGEQLLAARVPFLILAWFRLRESLGLSNPVIDHGLMKPHYAQLPPAQGIYSDPTLDAVISRLRREEIRLLGDLSLETLPASNGISPVNWGPPDEVAAIKMNTVRRKDNYNIREMRVPADWVDMSLPEMLRFRDPASHAEFTVTAYRNPGLSYIEWADRRLPVFAAAHPSLRRTRDRYAFDHYGFWWGWAEEFEEIECNKDESVCHLVVCFKNKLCLYSVTVMAPRDVFAQNDVLYRWLIQVISLSDVDFEKNPISVKTKGYHQDLWADRQDMPGLKRLATENRLVDSDVVTNIGLRWYFGQGDTPEVEQASQDKLYAAEWFERAAELGNADAQNYLSVQLSNGDGVPKDSVRAAMWCRKAAEQGHANAQNLLASLYWDADGVEFNMGEARAWFGKAAAQGHEAAQRALNRWTAADEGKLSAIYELACLHEKAKRYCEAIDLYRQIADHVEATPVNSSDMFDNGSAAQCNLADKYEHGLGVAQDLEQALYWYRKSAAKNNHVAQYSLGNMYLAGLGVPADVAQARDWLKRSADNGYKNAQSALQEIVKFSEDNR